MTLNFACTNQSLIRTDNNILAANSQKYVEAHFTFDESWEGYAKWAYFEHEGKAYKVSLDGLDSCWVAYEVINEGYFSVSVYGTKDNSVITTNRINIEVLEGPSEDAENSQEPTQSDLDQIYDIVYGVRRDADEGKFNGSAATVSVGTVESVSPSENAEVTNSGDNTNAVLNFKLPKGRDGESLYAVGTLDELKQRCLDNAPNNATYSLYAVWCGEDIVIGTTVGDVTLKAGNIYNAIYKRSSNSIFYTNIRLTKAIGGTEISEDIIRDAVNDYLEANPPVGGSGADGKSAYEIWLDEGNEGTEADFLASLKGEDGKDGSPGADGIDGKDGYTPIKGVDYFDGKDGAEGPQGPQGVQGIPGEKGDKGDKGDSGEQGIQGVQGIQGIQGEPGKDGAKGDKGDKGEAGKSAYTYAVEGGYTGSEEDFAELMSRDLFRDTGRSIAPYTNMALEAGLNARSVIANNGDVSDATYNVYTTGFIPMKIGDVIRVKQTDGTSITTTVNWALYDENKTLQENRPNTALSVGRAVSTIQQYDAYGSLSIDGNYAEWDTSGITYGQWTDCVYARLTVVTSNVIITVNEEITDNVEKVYEPKPTLQIPKSSLTFNVAEKPLVGKKVVCLGDSLFGQTRDETSALYRTAEITGAELINAGFGGTSMSRLGSGAFSYFSLPALTDAIISGTWTNQDANVTASAGWDEQLPKLKSVDFSTVDILVLHYGTNDFAGGDRAIDNTSDIDDKTTICGGLRYSIDRLLTAYPQIKFYISLPVFRYWGSEGAYVYPDTYTNALGNTLPDVIEALRGVAAEYNLPVIDGYHGMGVNKLNAAYYLRDKTHHSIAGMRLFGEFIAAQLTAQQSLARSGIETDKVNELINAAIGDAIGGSY